MRVTDLALLIAALAAALPPSASATPPDADATPPSIAAPTSTAAPTPTATPPQPWNALPAKAPAPRSQPASAPALVPAEIPFPTAADARPAATERQPLTAVAEKVALGDRAFTAGDFRGALFAYQDAVYLEPTSAAARVRLGRAYLALRYPAQARTQAEQALALDAGSADARQLLDDAIAGRIPSTITTAAPGAATPSPATPATPAPPATPVEGDPPQRAPAGSPQARDHRPTPDAAPSTAPAVSVVEAPRPTTGAAPVDPAAAERYRAGVALIARRDYARAIAELDVAIATDGRLGVAYAARATARLGLGRHREAAQDYVSALDLDPALGTPLFGLAECYRAAGDPRAAELYRRYAASGASDVREDLRTLAVRRAAELSGR